MKRNGFKGLALALALVAGIAVFGIQNANAYRIVTKPSPTPGTFETVAVLNINADANGSAGISNFGPNSYIYGFSIRADGSNAQGALYDCSAFKDAAMTQGVFIDELAAATQSNVVNSDWPAPYKLVTGLTVVATDALVVVYGDPQT